MITFEPSIADRVEFYSDKQFYKGPFTGSVLRMDNEIVEIGHSDGQDWGFFVTSSLKVKSKTETHDGKTFWKLF